MEIIELDATEKYGERWSVPGSTDRLYTVARKRDSWDWECSCLGWIGHVPRKDCRHINQLLEYKRRRGQLPDYHRVDTPAASSSAKKRTPGVVKADEAFTLQTTRRIRVE